MGVRAADGMRLHGSMSASGLLFGVLRADARMRAPGALSDLRLFLSLRPPRHSPHIIARVTTLHLAQCPATPARCPAATLRACSRVRRVMLALLTPADSSGQVGRRHVLQRLRGARPVGWRQQRRQGQLGRPRRSRRPGQGRPVIGQELSILPAACAPATMPVWLAPPLSPTNFRSSQCPSPVCQRALGLRENIVASSTDAATRGTLGLRLARSPVPRARRVVAAALFDAPPAYRLRRSTLAASVDLARASCRHGYDQRWSPLPPT